MQYQNILTATVFTNLQSTFSFALQLCFRMEENLWMEEVSQFAKALSADLISRHPVLYKSPCKQGGSCYFTEDIGKCVMLKWHEIRNEIEPKLRNDFPRFAANEGSLKEYLNLFINIVKKGEKNVINQYFYLSAILLEIICFVHRRGIIHYVHDTSKYLLFMLLSINSVEFCKEGGWKQLASEAKKLTKGYDEEEICKQYLLTNVCHFNAPRSRPDSEIFTSVKVVAETSDEGIDQSFKEVPSIGQQSGKDRGNNSVNVKDMFQCEKSKLNDSPHQSPNNMREEASITFSPEMSIPDTRDINVQLSKSQDSDDSSLHHRLSQMNEVSEASSKSVKTSEKEFVREESSSQTQLDPKPIDSRTLMERETSQTTFELQKDNKNRTPNSESWTPLQVGSSYISPKSVKQYEKLTDPNQRELLVDVIRKATVDDTQDHVKDNTMSQDSLENIQDETIHFDSEFAEVDRFLINEITSHFQVRFLTEEELRALNFFEEDTPQSSEEKSKQELPTDKSNINITDELKVTSTELGESDLHGFAKCGGNPATSDSTNDIQKHSMENKLDSPELLSTEKNFPATSYENVEDPAKQKLLKASITEISKNSPPGKDFKSPTAKKTGVRDVKDKTPTQRHEKTPSKTPTTDTPKSSPFLASKAKNKTESKRTPKTLKSDSVEIKCKGASDHLKTPTDQKRPKILSKSTEKVQTKCMDSSDHPKTPTDRVCTKMFSKSSEKLKVISAGLSGHLGTPPTDRGRPKLQSKSSEKVGRRLSLTKTSQEISKLSPRSQSANNVNIKSHSNDPLAANSSKPLLVSVTKPKQGEKDPSGSLKLPANTSSVTKHKIDEKRTLLASDKVKKNPFKPKAVNAKEGNALEKTVDDTTAKPTDVSRSKPVKSFKNNVKLNTEQPSVKCGEIKSNEPSASSSSANNAKLTNTTGYTRTVPGKSALSDSKAEKPRWR